MATRLKGHYGNVPKIKLGYNKIVGLGEGLASYEFIMTFEADTVNTTTKVDFSNSFNISTMRYLVQTTQFPALARENIESYGPQGVQFNQAGRFKNAQDVPVSFKETISGHAYAFLRDWVINKRYHTVKLQAAGESLLAGNQNAAVLMDDCWLELEGADLSVEDASIVRPSGTIHANWVGWDETTSLGLTLETLP